MQKEDATFCAPAGATDDAALLQDIARGNQDALAMLYQCYGAQLLSYLRRFLTDSRTAEEVLQDTFLAVWRCAGTYSHRSSVRLWLLGIARRQAMNRLRRDGALTRWLEHEEDVIDQRSNPETLVLVQLEVEDLYSALGAIGPLHREVLGLLLVDGLSYAEIALVLEVPIGTVRSRVNTARQRVVARLRSREVEYDATRRG
jgi:RNA polymerase sigma-70 factor (ECF subfamily)